MTSRRRLIFLAARFADVQSECFVEVRLGIFPDSRRTDLSRRRTASTDLERKHHSSDDTVQQINFSVRRLGSWMCLMNRREISGA